MTRDYYYDDSYKSEDYKDEDKYGNDYYKKHCKKHDDYYYDICGKKHDDDKNARSMIKTIMIDGARSTIKMMISAARNITKITLIDTAKNVTMTKKMMRKNVARRMKRVIRTGESLMTMINVVKRMIKMTIMTIIILMKSIFTGVDQNMKILKNIDNIAII